MPARIPPKGDSPSATADPFHEDVVIANALQKQNSSPLESLRHVPDPDRRSYCGGLRTLGDETEIAPHPPTDQLSAIPGTSKESIVKIQVNIDKSLESNETIIASIEADVQSAFERHADRLTRIEVHLGDEDGAKDGSGADKRCLLEARPSGLKPVVVTAFAGTVEQACHDATRKMQSLLKSTFGRIDGRDTDATIRQNEAT